MTNMFSVGCVNNTPLTIVGQWRKSRNQQQSFSSVSKPLLQREGGVFIATLHFLSLALHYLGNAFSLSLSPPNGIGVYIYTGFEPKVHLMPFLPTPSRMRPHKHCLSAVQRPRVLKGLYCVQCSAWP